MLGAIEIVRGLHVKVKIIYEYDMWHIILIDDVHQVKVSNVNLHLAKSKFNESFLEAIEGKK